MAISDGMKLIHVKDERFINEYADQVIGFGFASTAEAKIALTFGRDLAEIKHEIFKEAAPGAFQTVMTDEGFEIKRVDFATFTMSLEAAVRLRDLLNQMIDNSGQAPKL
ncbi:Uncharacterised protein [Stutzerimonas stutzeri]|uniref:hypothetical protein n=1 Tax=Stutzerimonas stutzeri subgroup TaxID=578833 RepID=UPI000C6D0342|nr:MULTISPECIES: hypothetical protein [Stutzerimonas stutzeri subgroup]MCQ2048798.1 hypothetical protein [Stutzerimonas kunmingensis]PKR26522.1 hypothetical protein CXK90_12830 [Stutzerimonas stutzeri]QQC13209.1 hypothetical protein I6I22_10545 [Stutzerimonas stutzeri]VEI35382.1 Uncharacterised protein [Stutzerimonas stutzeri]